jgi:hypothetical protein
MTNVTFAPVSAKFVRITLTTGVENGPPWSNPVTEVLSGSRGHRSNEIKRISINNIHRHAAIVLWG